MKIDIISFICVFYSKFKVKASSLAEQMDDKLNKQIEKNPFDGSHGVRKKVKGAGRSKGNDNDSTGRCNSVKPPVVSKTPFNTLNHHEVEPQAKITQWFAEEPLDLTKSKTENVGRCNKCNQ